MIARRTRVVVSLAMAIAVLSPVTAHADPAPTDPSATSGTSQSEVDSARRAVTDGEADVARVQAQLDAARAEIDTLHDRAELAAETANRTREVLSQKTAAAAGARAEATRAAAAAASSQGAVEQLATRLYMQGGVAPEFAWLLAGDSAGLARSKADRQAAEDHRTGALADARTAQSRAETARAKADAAQKAQQKAAADAATALADVQKAVSLSEKKQAELQAQETQLVTRLAALRRTSVEVEQRRQTQLVQAAQAAEQARVRDAMAAPTAAPAGLPAADNEAAGAAMAFARAQLGKPYLWGGTGPDRFDCSGLTLGSWTAAGRKLPRTAQWQYDGTARVPISALKPGDLVFFGSSDRTIRHVGLFVGNGMMIEAPRTGLNIRYSSIYRKSLLPQGGRVG